MSDTKHALVGIVNSYQANGPNSPVGEMIVDRVLARLAEPDDAPIEAMLMAWSEAYQNSSNGDRDRGMKCMRAAFAAAMRAIGTQP